MTNHARQHLDSCPTDLYGAWQNTFNNSSPDYYVGLNLNIPFRNRVAKADQYRSELEYRQASLRKEQLRKQIRIEVRNAQYALEQTGPVLNRPAKRETWRSAPSRSPRKSRIWERARPIRP